jgi:hypothetical protein
MKSGNHKKLEDGFCRGTLRRGTNLPAAAAVDEQGEEFHVEPIAGT